MIERRRPSSSCTTTTAAVTVIAAIVVNTALCSVLRVNVTNANEFIELSRNVNSGTNYLNAIVLLWDDIDFLSVDYDNNVSSPFSPIGVNSSHYFAGVFNGQGHVIRNLVLNTSERYTGLFGFSWGSVIRNVVIDESCSITSTYTQNQTYSSFLGGVIAYCEEEDRDCDIENNVNMASVTFSGNTTHVLYFGGIAGSLSSLNDFLIQNCANYGQISFTGVAKAARIGGLVGFFSGGSSSEKGYIRNCLNYGSISVKSTSKDVFIGGIIGSCNYNVVDDCVSAGNITDNLNGYTGSLTGYAKQSTFERSYYSDTAYERTFGYTGPGVVKAIFSFSASNFVLNMPVSVGGSSKRNVLIEALNAAADQYYLRDYSHWLLNRNIKEVSFTINNRTKSLTLNTQLILLPSLANGRSLCFDGWYNDSSYTQNLTDFEIASDTPLYGKWEENNNNYTISFETYGGSPVPPITRQYGNIVELPIVTGREHCEFKWWENDYQDKVPLLFSVQAHNITLHAVWGCDVIYSKEDFIDFMNIVNSGSSPKSTVFLGADIDMSNVEFNSSRTTIGDCSLAGFDCYPYSGTFDGLGHRIIGINISSSMEYVSIFGYSEGATIRNLVVDSTSAIKSVYRISLDQNSHIYVGGVISYCGSYISTCNIENVVNMASVIFDGSTSNNAFLGGIAGYLTTTLGREVIVKNCANYGTITYSGKRANYANIGGIAGGIVASMSGGYEKMQICNCLNYGTTEHNGDSDYASIGGIMGYGAHGLKVSNCVSTGVITASTSSRNIGMIVGCLEKSRALNCYYTNTSIYPPFGKAKEGTSNVTSFDEEFVLSSTVVAGKYTGTSLLDALNSYSDTHSKWILNRNKSIATFSVESTLVDNSKASNAAFNLSSQIIILPDIKVDKNSKFRGWYIDQNLKKRFKKQEISKDTTLYGKVQENVNKKRIILIASLSATTTIFAFIIIFLSVLIVWIKTRSKMEARRAIQDLIEPLLFDVLKNSLDDMADLYSEDYERPTIKDALVRVGTDPEKADVISTSCHKRAENLDELGKLPKGVTLEDAAAIALYTMETKALEKNPYRIINEALMDGSLEALEPVKDLMYLIMTALRKMPIVYGKPLYRGIRSDVLKLNDENNNNNSNNNGSAATAAMNKQKGSEINGGNYDDCVLDRSDQYRRGINLFENNYMEGEEIVWLALSSTSPDITVTKEFLARCSTSGKAEGTLFIIEDGWGYNVQPCSMYPGEEEIVLEPERRFRVKAVIPGEGLTIVKMEMLKTPIILPDVFGKKEFGLFQ